MMTDPSLDERLNRLGRELGTDPQLAARVLEAVSRPDRRRPGRTPSASRWLRCGLWGLAAAAAVVVLAVVWLSQPETLYARALKALEQAETVHVTGSTTRILRQWPLEDPQPDAEPKQHPVEMWFWRDDDGTPRTYERIGPVIQVRNGVEFKEYQQDVRLLFIAQSSAKDYVEYFSTLTDYLKALDRKGMQKEDLGTREEDGRKLSGLKIEHGNRIEEYWFDTQTGLPVRFSATPREEDADSVRFELRFRYDQPVPPVVARYEPPETQNVRYGHGHRDVQLAWRRHVQEIGQRLREQPIEGRVALLPRQDRKTFAHQWMLPTPDGRYWVVPLDLDQHFPLSLRDFIRLRVAGFTSHDAWRVPEELQAMKFRREDLVFEEGTSWEEWVQYVLNQYGLEYVDVTEQRTYWIAQHEGRELKPWQEVNPPVPYVVEGGVEKKGYVRPGVGEKLVPVTLHELFDDFNRNQNHKLTADHPIIVDETGLPRLPKWDKEEHPTYQEYRENVRDKYLVATDSPWFAGEESRAMAREWYAREFGITFTEQKRPATVHVVRRKK